MKRQLVKFFGYAVAAILIVSCSSTANDSQAGEAEQSDSASTSLVAEAPASDGILELGAKAPAADVKMNDVSGTELALSEVAKDNGLLVIFSCNTCPFVIGNGTKTDGWEGRYANLYDYAAKANIGMALINPNEAKRTEGDGMDDMKKRYAEKGFKGYYLLDANHQVADAFGALTTPHVFLFDGNMKLIYKGAIDDNVDKAGEVKIPYLMNAIDAHLAGKPIDPNSTRQLGCSIKRVKA